MDEGSLVPRPFPGWRATLGSPASHLRLSSYCRQVIRRSRTYCTSKIRAKWFWSKVDRARKSRAGVGKVQQRRLGRKSIVTLFNNSEPVHTLTVNTTVDTDGKPRDFTQNFKNEHLSLERLQTKKASLALFGSALALCSVLPTFF